MVLKSPDPRPEAGVNSAKATRLAHSEPVNADHVGSTRIAHSPADDGEATRIAHDARGTDLETEGTRILGHRRPTLTNSGFDQEAVERYKVGDRIGDRYEVLAIHSGSMGVVYGTFDHTEKVPRALKTLQQRHAGNREMRDLFASEVLTWIRLEKHPFIVRAYLVEKFYGQPYVITEYVRGQQDMGGDLRASLGHPKLTMPIAVEMALQIAQCYRRCKSADIWRRKAPFCMAVSAKLPRLQPCAIVLPLRRVKGALRQAA